MSKRISYDHLHILPNLVAEMICQKPYTGMEISIQSRDFNKVKEIEAKRQAMTSTMIREFSDMADERCRAAYGARAKWFELVVKAKDNKGRDQLYIWIAHWLASYLTNPVLFRKMMERSKVA